MSTSSPLVAAMQHLLSRWHLRHGIHRLERASVVVLPTAAALVSTDNKSMIEQVHSPNSSIESELDLQYITSISILLLVCIVSVCINITVLVAAYWVRRPMTPTLHISLSLAGADAYTSFIWGLAYIFNSLLPKFGISMSNCFLLYVEALRLGGIITIVAHLLLLAINHYLGIRKPLHYMSIMTHKKTSLGLALLWVLSPAYFIIYFWAIPGQGLQAEPCNYTFLMMSKFRYSFSVMFFVPLLVMFCIYSHIFIIVRRHQAQRLRFSTMAREGQSETGVSAGVGDSLQNGSVRSRQQNQAHQQMKRNVKAIYTTLYILGSYIVGLLPAVLVFIFFCNGCLFKIESLHVYIYALINMLVIFKTLINPIIYAARMNEIKLAMQKMRFAFLRCCCRCLGLSYGENCAGMIPCDTLGLSSQSSTRHHQSTRLTSQNCFLSRGRSCNGSTHAIICNPGAGRRATMASKSIIIDNSQTNTTSSLIHKPEEFTTVL